MIRSHTLTLSPQSNYLTAAIEVSTDFLVRLIMCLFKTVHTHGKLTAAFQLHRLIIFCLTVLDKRVAASLGRPTVDGSIIVFNAHFLDRHSLHYDAKQVGAELPVAARVQNKYR